MPRSALRLDGLRRIALKGLSGSSRLAGASARTMRRYPVASLGTFAFGAFFLWVSGNALFGQHEPHPAPLVATRGMPHPTLASSSKETRPDPLLHDLQSALARTGHYKRMIDGRFGPGTRSAIEKFQSENGMPVDGKPTSDLLNKVRQIAAYAAPSPSPKPAEWTDVEEYEITATADGRSSRVIQTPQTVSSIIATETQMEIDQEELVRQIQTGLNAISPMTLAADGIVGERTTTAIENFEKAEGLDVTGKPNIELLEHLKRVGAFSG